MCFLGVQVVTNIQQNGGIIEYPVIFDNGWEYYKIVCLNLDTQSSVLKYIQSLEHFEILSIKDLEKEGVFKYQFISTHDLIENLTEKQLDVVSQAYEEGYYEIPRKVKTEDLADHFGVSRPATEKSMRKAENEIMASIMPYLLFHRRIRNNQETKHGSKQSKLKKIPHGYYNG